MTSKKRKIGHEHRGFQNEWTEAFAFIAGKNDLPFCLICKENLSSNKKSNVERHFIKKHASFAETYPAGNARQCAINELQRKTTSEKSSFASWMKTSNDITIASFVVAHEIAKRGKPFIEGQFLKETFIKLSEELFVNFKNKNDIINKIESMPLSARTITDRISKMSEDITNQQIHDIHSASGFSIACDESCDIKDIAQLTLHCRYVHSEGPKEELIGLLPLCEQTRGQDIESAVSDFLIKKNLDFEKIVSIATDGSPNMVGREKGFVALLKKRIKHDIISFHCIIHQEALCTQSLPDDLTEIMNLVVKIVNKISAGALNRRQFRHLMEELNHQYSDLLMHNKVRWLSRGKVLSRFADCLEEVRLWLAEKGIEYSELTNTTWLQKFFFMTDVFSHFNELNRKLQGRGTAAIFLLDEILSFERKLILFKEDIETKKLLFFPSLKQFQEETKCEFNVDLLAEIIEKIQTNFSVRFQEFREQKPTLNFVLKPLEAKIEAINFSPFQTVNSSEFQLQLEDLKIKDLWSNKFNELLLELEELEREKCKLASEHKWSELSNLKKQDEIIFKVWNQLPECFCELKKVAFGVLSVFGSTYICEQFFSKMNFVKNKHRSQIADTNLEACLKLMTSTYSPNTKILADKLQQQKSH